MNKFTDVFCKLTNDEEEEIRSLYKIIDITQLNSKLLKSKIFLDASSKVSDTSSKVSDTSNVIETMMDYYLNHKDINIYKKTDYFCNEKEKICICNIYAENFRKIYDGKQGDKYISWFKKIHIPNATDI